VAELPKNISPQAVAIGRQPIVGPDGRIRAYELLFRQPGGANRADFPDSLQATASVLHRAIEDVGIDSLLQGKLGFLNVDERFLAADFAELLSPDHFLLEVLENAKLDESTLASLRALHERGFRIAYDDFEPTAEHFGRLEKLDSMVSLIKVDLSLSKRPEVEAWVRHSRWQGDQLLAEKVETREQFEWALSVGFGLFQGWYFARPDVIESQRKDPSRNAVLQLVRLITADKESGELLEVLDQHPDLCVSLLRLINSAAYARGRRISSISMAFTLLGRKRLLQWLLLMLHHGGAPLGADPVFISAASRSFLMEEVSTRLRHDPARRERAFLAGIAASLDAVMGRPLPVLMEEFGFDNEIVSAVLRDEGPLGNQLKLCRLQEQMLLDEVAPLVTQIGLTPDLYQSALMESFMRTASMLQDAEG
jgi:EAL and modified HD-GYP domain-containing signal transduction protein